MNRKFVSVITLVAFSIFTISCAVHRVEEMAAEKAEAKNQAGKKVRIMSIVTDSGESIDFPKGYPGAIVGDNIVSTGSPVARKTWTELDKADIKATSKDSQGKVIELRTEDGKIYKVEKDTYSELGNKVMFTSVTQVSRVSVPLSDVELVRIRHVDVASTFLATLGSIALVFVAAGLIAAALKESCPFIYSFNGEEYIFDAEPYGGATCEGLKRTEWCRLDHLEEVDGFYHIMIKNEVDETQYTDEIKLLVIDHPKGVRAIPDEAGNIHTISRPATPSSAYDNRGRNLMFYVAENDWIY
jgi:hypothetical protein